MALRDLQETEMRDWEHLVHQASIRLEDNADLCADIMELHRIGAIPKFRGPTPSEFCLRAPP